MILRLRRMWAEESGFTLAEMAVALIVTSMVMAVLVSTIYSFTQNAEDSAGKAEIQGAAREIIYEMVLELRQATAVDAGGDAIESITADSLTFYTDRAETPGPERIVYDLRNCNVDGCELWVARYASSTVPGNEGTFESVAMEDAILLTGVLNDQPTFAGSDWAGDPKVKVSIPACSATTTRCEMPLVAIRLRVTPWGTSEGANVPLELVEEVRLRNA